MLNVNIINISLQIYFYLLFDNSIIYENGERST